MVVPLSLPRQPWAPRCLIACYSEQSRGIHISVCARSHFTWFKLTRFILVRVRVNTAYHLFFSQRGPGLVTMDPPLSRIHRANLAQPIVYDCPTILSASISFEASGNVSMVHGHDAELVIAVSLVPTAEPELFRQASGLPRYSPPSLPFVVGWNRPSFVL